MKKLLLSIILILAMIISLSACSFDDFVGGLLDDFIEEKSNDAFKSLGKFFFFLLISSLKLLMEASLALLFITTSKPMFSLT